MYCSLDEAFAPIKNKPDEEFRQMDQETLMDDNISVLSSTNKLALYSTQGDLDTYLSNGDFSDEFEDLDSSVPSFGEDSVDISFNQEAKVESLIKHHVSSDKDHLIIKHMETCKKCQEKIKHIKLHSTNRKTEETHRPTTITPVTTKIAEEYEEPVTIVTKKIKKTKKPKRVVVVEESDDDDDDNYTIIKKKKKQNNLYGLNVNMIMSIIVGILVGILVNMWLSKNK